MAILTGSEIKKRLNDTIIIEPFIEENLNPNSYNLTIGDEVTVYNEITLDPTKDNQTAVFKIPETGLVLKPGTIYLASTNEYTETYGVVPIIMGRSSMGRIGLSVHQSAGLGDIGFRGNFTLQISIIHPIRIYPNMKICQIVYHTVEGDTEMQYEGRYQDSTKATACKIYKDFE